MKKIIEETVKFNLYDSNGFLSIMDTVDKTMLYFNYEDIHIEIDEKKLPLFMNFLNSIQHIVNRERSRKVKQKITYDYMNEDLTESLDNGFSYFMKVI
jgi:hypothetical protein